MSVIGVRGLSRVRHPGGACGAPGVGLPAAMVWFEHGSTSWVNRAQETAPADVTPAARYEPIRFPRPAGRRLGAAPRLHIWKSLDLWGRYSPAASPMGTGASAGRGWASGLGPDSKPGRNWKPW